MIFRGSRYTETEADYDAEGNLAFKDRKLFKFNKGNCSKYTFCQGDRLDLLAYKFYSDPRLWWVLLEVNTNYLREEDIHVGDTLLIPSPSEVDNLYER